MSTVPTVNLPSLAASSTVPRSTAVLVVGLAENGLSGLPDSIDAAYQKQLGQPVAALAASLGAKAKAGTSAVLPAAGDGPRVVVIGIGAEEPTPEDLRRAAAVGLRTAAGLADEGESLPVAVSLVAEEPEVVQAVAEGALLGTYRYQPISGKPTPAAPIDAITVVTSQTKVTPLFNRATLVARAVLVTREWVNTPPNLLYPETLADQARSLVKDSKVAIEVLDEKALVKGGYGGILAVGGGSSRAPRLVRLSYSPRGAKAHLALVGKGITFDSGGLNLKPGDSMYTMKCDMAGAAAVIAATHAIAELGLKVKITAYGALAENIPSHTAFRPSDVLTMYGGTTVENGNTDAEGRLVMADALARAAAEDKPDLLVDIATLTGACMVALGDKTAGLMTNDDDVADRLLDAAESAGEQLWQLPIPSETRAKLDSKVADLKSTGTDRFGGTMLAAAFLREFVGETPWAHLDIAGPAFHEAAPFGYVAPGGTGFGVRTLISLATALEA